jgi:hypothetical protein
MAPHLKVHLASRDETVEGRDVFALRAVDDQPHAEVGMYPSRLFFFWEYVTWAFSPNNNGIAHQGRAG